MRRIGLLIVFLALSLLAVRDAFAHGGQYTGPGGTGTGDGFAPGGTGTPGGVTPGGTGHPGGSTGGGNGGGTGGGGGSGGTGGGLRPGPSPAGPGPGLGHGGGSTPSGGKKEAGQGAWGGWWKNNDDRFLKLRAHLRTLEASTDSGDIFVAEVGKGDDIVRGLGVAMKNRILATLKEALKDPFFDARAAAAIALGKVASVGVQQDILSLINDENQQVRESACLALGLVGDKAVVGDLIEIMKNTDRAKREIAKNAKDLSVRTRAFAALALGLIGARADISDTAAQSALIAQAVSNQPHEDLVVTPIVALGIMRAEAAVPGLLSILKDEEKTVNVRSYAATSLGKIGARSAIPDLVRALGAKESVVNESAAIALGALANSGDAEAVEALMRLVRSTPDVNAKDLGLIALGEIGGVPARDFLLKVVEDKNQSVRCFAALALGVYGFKNEDPNEAAIGAKLLAEFNGQRSPDIRGAFAIAMGLMKYRAASASILSALDAASVASLRGALCTSLGLLGETTAVKDIQEIVKDNGDVEVRREAAIALGLLGDREAVGILRKVMEESANSIALNGAATQALGFIGDMRAVEPLAQLVGDRVKAQDATRAFAAVALGLLGDKDEISLLARIMENQNYLIATEAMAEVSTIL